MASRTELPLKDCPVLLLVVPATWVCEKAYGFVFRVKRTQECGTEVENVVRVSRVSNQDEKAIFNSMVSDLLGRQRKIPPHKYVAQWYFAVCGQSVPIMLSQWHANGDVVSYLDAHPEAVQVSQGLIHLHNHGSVHGNLYPGNIMVTSSGYVQLTDSHLHIESCRWFQGFSSLQDDASTRYRAPEILNASSQPFNPGPFTCGADVYALATTTYTILSGKRPQPLGNKITGRALIPRGFEESGCDIVSGKLWRILESCWDIRPEKRPKATVLLVGLEPKGVVDRD